MGFESDLRRTDCRTALDLLSSFFDCDASGLVSGILSVVGGCVAGDADSAVVAAGVASLYGL